MRLPDLRCCHLVVGVTDMVRALVFYRDLLGMDVVFDQLISGEPFDAVLHANRRQERRVVGGLIVYASAKEAQRAMAKVAALEWGVHGIRVNAICPLAESDGVKLWKELTPEDYQRAVDRVPLRRIGDARSDVGSLVALLLATTPATSPPRPSRSMAASASSAEAR